ncbi:MAG TPA: outer membrane protein assembly factor BamD [Candidatus Binataceae bacterium]|nr:outer membrane protein assembly factor BamD [Candidatus Binataceae bacterium]
MRRLAAIILAVSIATAAGCALKKPPTGEDYYQQAQLNFAQAEYNPAIENYQLLIDHFPFSPYAEDAEMKIGLAYYKMQDYAEAVSALDDFQRMHPTSKNLELVSYYIAMSSYDQMGREDQDQSKTEDALKHFQIIEARFPEGAFAELAKERAEECREMLARHQMVVGNYYFKRANFRAAESRLAELMQKYPDTPVAPDALFELAQSLQKEGKKYSAAQAYTALLRHYPDTPYTAQAKASIKELNQPIDSEEDPLPMVLAETGYGSNNQQADNHVIVRQRDAGDFGSDAVPGEPGTALAGTPAAQAPAQAQRTAHAVTKYGPDGLPILDQPAAKTAAQIAGPATLKTIRMSASDPPMAIIFDLTGPVVYNKRLENGAGFSSAILTLKDVTPDTSLEHHLVFDRSIFKDCDVTRNAQGTVVTLNTVPLSDVEVVPLDSPPRLLVTFTPVAQSVSSSD